MLIETLEDSKTYLKATLLQCLQEAKAKYPKVQATYKTIIKREKMGFDVYSDTRRDPATGYRMYTGLQIRKIVEFEIAKATANDNLNV